MRAVYVAASAGAQEDRVSWTALPEADRDLYAEILTPLQLDMLRHRTNGHSWRRIAMAVNLDESTCRGHYRRALERIRKHSTQEAA